MAGGRLYPVILSGGSGSRLWPLSREDNPKQLQALVTEKTLLQDTALRLSGGAPRTEAPIIVCNEVQRFIVAEQLRMVDIEPKAVVIEPMGRNTAPAVAVAAHLLADEPDALMLVMPSDHLIRRPDAFRVAVDSALPAARAGRFVTFGITPTDPSTAYGYIKRGGALESCDGYKVERFVEKPNAQTAASYVASGDYFWNAGIFLFSARAYLNELAKHEPAIGPACAAALDNGKTDLFFFRLDADAFSKSPNQSIDYGVMERTDKAAVVPVDMGWSDVGSWSALHAENTQDADGNTLLGDVVAVDAEGSYVRSEKQLTTVLGVKNVVVVVTPDAVLVADKSRDQDVKAIVDKLKKANRTEATQAAITHRPWGWFQTIDEGHRFKVKRIVVKPGAKLSLQKHWHRSEHWVVVTGTAIVTRDKDDFLLRENESTFIPAGTVHRLSNPGHVELHMIEVQSGEYVGEDDIVRLVDDYGRSGGEGSGPSRKVKAKAKAAVKKTPKSTKTRRKAGAVPAKRRSARRKTRRQR